jgi:hypothetical protein
MANMGEISLYRRERYRWLEERNRLPGCTAAVSLSLEGNFNAPMLVHGTTVPGTSTMNRLKEKLHWDLQETPRGARINVTADNKEALDAVHEFLKFQIDDHKTGDCPMVH